MGGNDRLLVPLEREHDCRDEVSKRFADPSSCFHHQMTLFLQRLRYARCHFLLLRAELEILRLRQWPVFRKERVDTFYKLAAQVVLYRDHSAIVQCFNAE